MCVAIFKPPSVKIDDATLRAAWHTNSHGAGFAYLKKGKVKISKGYMTYDEFKTAWDIHTTRHPGSPFLLHFRIRTQGALDQDRTHPFEVANGAVIHNGSINGTGVSYNDNESDTSTFAKKLGPKLTYEFVSKHKAELDSALGWNKLVFLYNNGKHVIINENSGAWRNGAWFSNLHWVPRTPTLTGASSCLT